MRKLLEWIRTNDLVQIRAGSLVVEMLVWGPTWVLLRLIGAAISMASMRYLSQHSTDVRGY